MEGRVWRNCSGKLSLYSDGIALSPDRAYVYYHTLTARTLYRIATIALGDENWSAAALAARVEVVAETGPTDDMIFDTAGNLYFTSMELNAVARLTPAGWFQLVAQDHQLKPARQLLPRPRWQPVRYHLPAAYSPLAAHRAVPDFQAHPAAVSCSARFCRSHMSCIRLGASIPCFYAPSRSLAVALPLR